jgi:hypothetical protein
MTIQEIITHFQRDNIRGFQLSKINGILNSTWLIYKNKEYFFFFDINQKIEFISRYKYNEIELVSELNYFNFIIEEVIN